MLIQSSFGLLQLHREDIHMLIQSSFWLLQLHREDIHTLIQSSFWLLQLHGENIHADTVVTAGESSVDSDLELLNDNNLQDDQIFETAGEVEVE